MSQKLKEIPFYGYERSPFVCDGIEEGVENQLRRAFPFECTAVFKG